MNLPSMHPLVVPPRKIRYKYVEGVVKGGSCRFAAAWDQRNSSSSFEVKTTMSLGVGTAVGLGIGS
ncbi:MAG: hypothetical protein R6U13_01645 [Desulfatiglandaceae bacterium]